MSINISMAAIFTPSEKISEEEIAKILKEHQEWLEDNSKGKRADFTNKNMEGYDFSGKDLSYAENNSISVLSRAGMEDLIRKGFPENTAVISFYDPEDIRGRVDYKPVDYSGVTSRVFMIGVRDIDIEVLPDFGLTYDTYFPEADELALFINSAIADGLDIICQCEYGQSRSAACCAAIMQYVKGNGIDIFADYRYYPNQLVYNKVINALYKADGDTD